MVLITFPDKKAQMTARGFLLRRFSGKVFKSGEHVFPEAAMAALAEANSPFMVQGKASCEKQVAALRSAAAGKIQ
jgi:hypothetical protein